MAESKTNLLITENSVEGDSVVNRSMTLEAEDFMQKCIDRIPTASASQTA